ncbi:MAG TPA: hypothetical protein DCQ04_04955 [Actinobacteria bacterium]|jgi:hypothetical protein|nr:hypothetical protein [Actinomycetota bacterium]
MVGICDVRLACDLVVVVRREELEIGLARTSAGKELGNSERRARSRRGTLGWVDTALSAQQSGF